MLIFDINQRHEKHARIVKIGHSRYVTRGTSLIYVTRNTSLEIRHTRYVTRGTSLELRHSYTSLEMPLEIRHSRYVNRDTSLEIRHSKYLKRDTSLETRHTRYVTRGTSLCLWSIVMELEDIADQGLPFFRVSESILQIFWTRYRL